MSSREAFTQDWEDLGRLDPLWAILSDPVRQHGEWDEAEFFASGQQQVAGILDRAERFGVRTGRGTQALDVGCGVGRLTRALGEHFEHVVGVDISEPMLEQARAYHEGHAGLSFRHGSADRLEGVPHDSFDFVLSSIVLQHLPDPGSILDALAAMVRALKPGGLLVAQTTSHTPWRNRIQPRSRAYTALRAVGVPPRVLYERLHLHPVRIAAVEPSAARERIEQVGAGILDEQTEAHPGGTRWVTYWVTKGAGE